MSIGEESRDTNLGLHRNCPVYVLEKSRLVEEKGRADQIQSKPEPVVQPISQRYPEGLRISALIEHVVLSKECQHCKLSTVIFTIAVKRLPIALRH